MVFSTKDKQTIISQRVDSGIWQGLYEFPLIESDDINKDIIVNHPVFKQIVNKGEFEIIPYHSDPVIHKLSHQHLYTRFYIIKTNAPIKIDKTQKMIVTKEVHKYPVPVLLGNFIDVFFK